MTLNEVLELDKKQASIQKINLFLSNQEKNSDDYVKALSFKAIILASLNKTDEALKLLYEYLPNITEMNTEGKIALLDGIIKITLENELYEQALKYIELKKTFLPISKGDLYIKDKIEFYLKINDLTNAKKELLSYLDDDISKDELIYAKIKLSDIYYNEKQYDKYLELLPDVKAYYETNLALESLSILTIRELKISLIRKNYNKIILDGKQFIDSNDIKMKYIIEIVSLVLRAYIEIGELKKASILESNYSDYISNDYLQESLDFCYQALELYKKTNSLVSIKDYESKIANLESLKVKDNTPKSKKKYNVAVPEIELPQEVLEELEDINFNKILNPSVDSIKTKATTHEIIRDVDVSSNYNLLAKVFNELNQVDLNLKFREIFRLCAIQICKILPIDEIYILYFNKNYIGLHYKKERVYDKKPTVDMIEGTISYQSLITNSEYFLDQANREFNRDIVKNEEYLDEYYGFSVPISNSIECFGSIAYFSNCSFLDTVGVYESLKLVSMMLSSRLLLFLKANDRNLETEKLLFIKDNMSSGLKECVEGYIHLSPQACNILGVLEDLTLSDFYNQMEASDITNYKNILESLYNLDTNKRELEYNFRNKEKIIRVKERFYPMMIEGTIHILSLIDDVTKENYDKNKLLGIAYTNPISKLDTEYRLLTDLESIYSKRQLSLSVIEIYDFDIYEELYGYLFSKQLVYAIGKSFKSAISKYFDIKLYHLEGGTFALLMENINDKRSIESKLNSFFDFVHNDIAKINSRVSIYFKAGVYRMSKNVNLEKSSMILDNAKDALNNSRVYGLSNSITHYDGEEMRKSFNKKALVTHISECIDHGNLVINYLQIVNLKSVDVHGYRLKLGIDNYEVTDELLNSVIERRDLVSQMDKYLIMNAFKEEKIIYDKCKGFINIFIEINPSTIELSLISFLSTQLQFFKIDPRFVAFEFNDASSIAVSRIRALGFRIASYSLLDVLRENCDYYYYDYHSVTKESINEIYDICQKHKVLCILNEINDNDDILLARENGYSLVYGKYYKKSLRIKSILDKIK